MAFGILKAKVYAMCFGTYKGGYLKISTLKKKKLSYEL
jgi:hypothetical protein